MLKTIKNLVILSAFLSSIPALGAELNIGADQRSALRLSIYNNDLALVNESRALKLPAGLTMLNIAGVSPLMNHASAVLNSRADGLQVIEQNFRAVTLPEDLLQHALGKMVSLISTNPLNGEQSSERAKVLAVAGGLILEIDGRYETQLAGRRIVYDELPAGVLSPTLSAGVKTAQPLDTQLNVSYLTAGLSWRADYIAQLNEARDEMFLRAMATLDNHTGISFKDAQIELIAGTVNQVQQIAPMRMQKNRMASAMMQEAVAPAPLADFHLYHLPGRYALENSASKQIGLFEARAIPVQQNYKLSGQANYYYAPNQPEQQLKIDSYIEFSNDKAQNLGLPMPAGVMRVYSTLDEGQNGNQSLRFIGEDRIDHTPAQVKIRLKTGQVFDLNATRRQLAFRRLPVQQPYRNHSETEIETVLSNAKDQAVTINVEEQFSGEWSLLNGPEPLKADARSAVWAVNVPANGKASLKLTIRVKS